MKIYANRESLSSALNLGLRAVPTTTPKPVLANALIVAESGRCTLQATDMEVAVKAGFDARVESHGSVLAPASLLRTILRECPDESILLEDNKQTLRVCGHSFKHDIPTTSVDEFPAMPTVEWSAVVEVPEAMFSACLKAVSPQADQQDSRYVLNCVYFDLSKSRLSLVATDGRCLAATEMAVTSDPDCNAAMALVPMKSARILSSLDSKLPLKLSFASNWIALESGENQVLCRLAEGRFPRWRDILAKHSGTEFSANAILSQLAALIRLTCIAAPDAGDGPKAQLIFKDGDVTVRCEAAGIDADSRMPCVASKDREFSFNWKFLLRVASCFDLFGDEPVQLSFDKDGPGVPMLFTRDHVRCAVVPLT